RLVDGRSREVMAASDLLLVASGTATLEGAVLGVPMEVVYRVSFLSWLAGMVLVKIPYISLVNIVSGRCVVPEYIQRAARPEEIAARAEELLAPGPRRQAMTDALRGVRTKLGEPGAAARAARVIMEMPALSAPSAEKGR
ncbi:MAG TPA: lipid-A-disaccharide synthase, partial [bacterium]|nr:lipid-A-disaccharide synthase [bacterium]